MKLILLIVVVLAIGYAGFYLGRIYYYGNFKPIPQPEQKQVTLGTGEALHYVAAGDSTAAGVGASTFEQTYTYQVANYLATSREVNYQNIGKSGAQTDDFIDEQLPQLIELQPDVITISIGANDLTHMVARQATLERLQQIIIQLTAQTEATVYLANIPNFNGATLLPGWYIGLIEQRSAGINQSLAKLETNRVKIVPIHDFGWDQFEDISVTYADDNFHPNDAGYFNWAAAFLSRVNENY